MTTQAKPSDRQRLANARRWVIKVGSALLTDDGRGLDLSVVSRLADQLAALRAGGRDVVLVSSGAIVAGLARLKLSERPHEVNLSQAAAAVGQSALVRAYEECLGPHGVTTAQILLSHADVRARDRYLNARSTLNTLLSMDVLPIVNENDTVVTDEIRLGDNDTLAALVANLVDADALLILTDQDGLMDSDPRRATNAQLIQSADVHDPELDQVAGGGSALGRGGMATKLSAARLAARSGTGTVIANGRVPDVGERRRRRIRWHLPANSAATAKCAQAVAGQFASCQGSVSTGRWCGAGCFRAGTISAADWHHCGVG